MSAPTTAREVTFYAILPATEAVYGPGLPSCPDGSGDLWWDDASYARYQAYDPIDEDAQPERFEIDAVSPNFCDGRSHYDCEYWEQSRNCRCHTGADPIPF